MKIRHGFVSNSSSSSFCIYGTGIKEEDLRKIADKLRVSVDDDDYDDYDDYIDTYDLAAALEKKEYSVGIENMQGEYFYIGRSYDSIKDDETGKQFKERTDKEVKELLGRDTKLGTCSEAWRDG